MPASEYHVDLTWDDREMRRALNRARWYMRLHLPKRWLPRIIGKPYLIVEAGSVVGRKVGRMAHHAEWRGGELMMVNSEGEHTLIARAEPPASKSS